VSTRVPNSGAAVLGSDQGTRDRRWLALAVIAVAQLMVALDATIVNIALPSAQRALGFDDGDRQWVVTAYTLAFAGLLLLGGRVADHLGGRRAFLIGLVGFAAASAFAGMATGLGMLVTGRALQGAFAALLAPTALSMVVVTFTEPRERAKAFGVYGAVASSGGALGLLLGGALTQYLDWRWCLYVNVAIAAVALVAGLSVLPNPPAQVKAAIDVISGLTITAGLALVVLGCSQAVAGGWAPGRVVVPLVGGVVAIGLFLFRQASIASPLLPLRILADRSRAGAYVALAAAVVGSFGMFLMLTYHFQVILHWSPLHAGSAFLPLAGAVSASAYLFASRLLPRVAPRTLIVPGLLVAAAGLALLSRLDASSGYLTLLLPAELLLGTGMGCVFTPAISVATTGVERRDVGVAAATASTAMQIGGSIGTAVLNTVAITATAAYLSTHARSATAARDALVHGYATATLWAAALLVAVSALALVLIRPRSHDHDRAQQQHEQGLTT
jgi:EmrB/QacA subfamily drug resistance transporter